MVRVGDSFRVIVWDRVSFRAMGWLGFMYYGPKLFKLNSLWRRIRKVKQNRAENHSFFPYFVCNSGWWVIIHLTLRLRTKASD